MKTGRSTPLQVGVTGGIGAGKSVVCRLFRCLGVPVYEADVRAKWLTDHLPDLRQDIIALLGPDSYTTAGTYNRPYVASRVFTSPDLLHALNQLVHPRVLADSDSWLTQHQQEPYVIREAALMNRAKDGNTLDYVVVVSASEEVRINRVRRRDSHRPEEEIKAIIQNQISEESRLALADFVITNQEDEALIPQVLQLHQLFLQKSD